MAYTPINANKISVKKTDDDDWTDITSSYVAGTINYTTSTGTASVYTGGSWVPMGTSYTGGTYITTTGTSTGGMVSSTPGLVAKGELDKAKKERDEALNKVTDKDHELKGKDWEIEKLRKRAELLEQQVRMAQYDADVAQVQINVYEGILLQAEREMVGSGREDEAEYPRMVRELAQGAADKYAETHLLPSDVDTP